MPFTAEVTVTELDGTTPVASALVSLTRAPVGFPMDGVEVGIAISGLDPSLAGSNTWAGVDTSNLLGQFPIDNASQYAFAYTGGTGVATLTFPTEFLPSINELTSCYLCVSKDSTYIPFIVRGDFAETGQPANVIRKRTVKLARNNPKDGAKIAPFAVNMDADKISGAIYGLVWACLPGQTTPVAGPEKFSLYGRLPLCLKASTTYDIYATMPFYRLDTFPQTITTPAVPNNGRILNVTVLNIHSVPLTS